MTDDRAKTPRTLMIADHLWEAFSTMAVEMGGDRDALINQALYTFARLNGFLVPADLKRLSGLIPPQLPPAMESSRPRPAPQLVSVPHGNPESVAKIAQQLAGGGARPISNPPTGAPVKPEPSLVEVDDSLLGEEGQATSMELPNIAASLGGIQVPPRPSASMIAPHRGDPGITPGGRTLVLLADGRELDRVVKERFLIGRGKHCDLIINSGKVSREHAAITREGSAWFIEDLGSSNGTWFDKRRISRRQIQEGDEYFICSEKLSCTFR
ncbi:MAG: FHA domain-containing protein [Myxococcales bacterium]